MRLLIDLQGAQGGNRNRGIGRLTRALARAMVLAPGVHEPLVFLNDAIPESAESLGEEFAALLPRENIRFWRGLAGASAIGGPETMLRRQASEQIRAHAIAALNVDAVHMSSVFEGGADDAITNWPTDLHRPPHVATFYDAIPLINRAQYLSGSWKHLARWYLRQAAEVRRYDGLLAISESSRSEALDHLGFRSEEVFNIRAGFDAGTFRPIHAQGAVRADLLARHGFREGYILFVGAGDPRKNESGLLQAYSLLSPAMRERHQLVIVGAGDTPGLVAHAAARGIRPEDMAFPRHVAEEDLPTLYATCGLFVMPSKHEGFGLPALEAMACGAPVVASNTTSLPEVVGWADALFDPHDPESIAERMRAALQDDAFRLRLVENGLRQAGLFSWENSACRAWAALEAMEQRGGWRARADRGIVPPDKPRLAVVGGLPAISPEAARSDLEFISELGRHYDVALFTRDIIGEDDDLVAFPCHAESDFAALGAGFDRILYRVGDTGTLIRDRLLPIFPGVVVLEDEASDGALPTAPDPSDRDDLIRAAFDRAGWRAIDGLRGDGAAVDPSLQSRAVLLRAALAVIERTDGDRFDGRAFAVRCRRLIEDAYVQGPAAQRDACSRRVAGYDLPDLARAIVQSFPAPGPARLLLDTSCIDHDASSQSLLLCREAGRVLVEPEGDTVAEVVRAEGEALCFARARAAAFLGLPLHGLRDVAVAVAPTDTLVLRADIGTGSPDVASLRSLRRRGLSVVALLLDDARDPSAVLSVADAVVCSTETLARATLARFEEGSIIGRHPVKIGWSKKNGEMLHMRTSEQWPLCWNPPTDR